jgi:hypothetical protein
MTLLQEKNGFRVGDRVKLPFDETGTIKRIEEVMWLTKYWVRIRKATMNKTNEIHDYFERHIELEENGRN